MLSALHTHTDTHTHTLSLSLSLSFSFSLSLSLSQVEKILEARHAWPHGIVGGTGSVGAAMWGGGPLSGVSSLTPVVRMLGGGVSL